MKKAIPIFLYILALSLLGYFIGNRIYVLDPKEAIPYLFYYVIFLIFYLVFTVWILIKTLKSNERKKLFLYAVLITWISMIGFPAYYISVLQEEGKKRQIALKKQEQIEYLKKLSDINKQIEIYPDSSSLYLKRARVYRSNGLYDKAIVEAKKSIELEQTSSALWELGWNYYISDDFENAKRIYLKAKEEFPNEEWVDKRLEVINRKLKEND